MFTNTRHHRTLLEVFWDAVDLLVQEKGSKEAHKLQTDAEEKDLLCRDGLDVPPGGTDRRREVEANERTQCIRKRDNGTEVYKQHQIHQVGVSDNQGVNTADT
jgi:hypothetical protein